MAALRILQTLFACATLIAFAPPPAAAAFAPCVDIESYDDHYCCGGIAPLDLSCSTVSFTVLSTLDFGVDSVHVATPVASTGADVFFGIVEATLQGPNGSWRMECEIRAVSNPCSTVSTTGAIYVGDTVTLHGNAWPAQGIVVAGPWTVWANTQ